MFAAAFEAVMTKQEQGAHLLVKKFPFSLSTPK